MPKPTMPETTPPSSTRVGTDSGNSGVRNSNGVPDR